MNVYVFIGPTISPEEAGKWLNAVYLPPVAQGDIISLLRKQPKIIGIIDGYFDQVPAVWHKEILLALSQGVQVVGGASMGALRAAELYSFGMVGVGEIFERYRDGKIEADDEVAVYHSSGEYGYLKANEPLVNIRKTLELACENAVISAATLKSLIAASRNTHYYQRSYDSLLRWGIEAGLPREEILKLEKYLPDHKVDLKKRDAIKVLEYIAGLEGTNMQLDANFQLQHTEYLEQLIDKDQSLREVDGFQMTFEMLANYARLECDDFLGLRDRSIANMQILEYAQRLGLSITETEHCQGIEDFCKSMNLDAGKDASEWARRNDLSEKEFGQFIDEWALIRKVKREYLQPDNRALIRQIRLDGGYESMIQAAAEKEKAVSSGINSSELDGVGIEELIAYYAQHKKIDLTAQTASTYASEMGFKKWMSLILELREFYIFHKIKE
jgi:hypothetical protein